MPDGTCIDGMPPFVCDDMGGRYQGNGTDCANVQCDGGEVGACCVQGTCVDGTTPLECTRMGGTYAGDGSECANNPC